MSCGLAALAEGNTLVGKYQQGLGFDQVGGGLESRSISLVLSCSSGPTLLFAPTPWNRHTCCSSSEWHGYGFISFGKS